MRIFMVKIGRFALVCSALMHLHALNVLQKVELHGGQPTEDVAIGQRIECAKLICYFNDKPSIHHLQTTRKDDDWEYQTYLLMHTECATAAQKAFDQIAATKHDHYYITTEKVQQPALGLKLEIGYNRQYVSLNYDTFDAITTQKGVLFRFINQPLLQRLASQERPLLQLAHREVGKQLKIGIDCGHGAQDTGAICNGIIEKELTLQLGLKLAQTLNKQGLVTVLTRSDDCAVALHERTTMMNNQGVDLLISIHANSAPSTAVYGIETFCAHPKLLQAQSNDHYEKELRTLLAARFEKAEQLAHCVHTEVLKMAQLGAYTPHDRHVRHAASHILLGSNMPTILIEVGFLTHPTEAQQLSDPQFQEHLTQGMAQGILAYRSTLEQTA